jgi:hypothetical protein
MEGTDYSHLSKAQRKKLKREMIKQQKEIERTQRQRKQTIRKITSYGIMLLFVSAVIGFFYWRSLPPKDSPIIEITPSTYNFGPVSQAKGVVSTLFTVSNEGTEALVLTGMDTSCGCTSASVVKDGQEGPRFSMAMHGTNPKGWREVILPGESVQLKVYYDPNVHKSMRGSVTRSVFVFSNDPRHSKKEVRITAVQVD